MVTTPPEKFSRPYGRGFKVWDPFSRQYFQKSGFYWTFNFWVFLMKIEILETKYIKMGINF